MKYSLWLLFLITYASKAQTHKVLVIGNYEPICIQSDSIIHFQFSDRLPESLFPFDALLIFSGTRSSLKSKDIDSIINFVAFGNGVYCGAENQPFQEEFNQISNRLFTQGAWGNFTNHEAILAEKSILTNSENKRMYAGQTTVAVPFNSMVKVEAWVDDQPIITSHTIGKGKIIFDGGYSRFYCAQFDSNKPIFTSIIWCLLLNNTQ